MGFWGFGDWLDRVPNGAVLLLSPDGELNFMPFSCLMDAGGKMLVERFDVGVLTSARDAAASIAPLNIKRALLLGNPHFDAAPTGSTSFRWSRLDEQHQRTLQKRGKETFNIDLQPLPGAEAEARNLDQFLQGKQVKTALLIGKEATEKSLRAPGDADLVHIATHACILPEAGDRTLVTGQMSSSVILLTGANATFKNWSQGQVRDTFDDGVLAADECAQLNLSGVQAMVLSACETGLGAAQPGEGVMGLRRGLHQAGVRHLVTSLWPIDDAATVDVMQRLYSGALGDGTSSIAALARSQRELLPKWRSEAGLASAIYRAAPFMVSISKGRDPSSVAPLEPIQAPSWVMPATPPSTSGSTVASEPPTSTTGDATSRISSFLERKIAMENAHDLSSIARFYGDSVTYFKEGQISKDTLLAKKSAYFSKFPSTGEKLVGSFDIQPQGSGSWKASYETQFTATSADGKVTFDGSQISYLRIAEQGDTYQIVAEESQVRQMRRNANGSSSAPSSAGSGALAGERYPQTRLRVLNAGDIAGMSLAQVRYAINEMFARHGATFKVKEIQAVFNKKPWYQRRAGYDYDDIEGSFFSELEKENLRLLGSRRDELSRR